jgi:hypothetical protein
LKNIKKNENKKKKIKFYWGGLTPSRVDGWLNHPQIRPDGVTKPLPRLGGWFATSMIHIYILISIFIFIFIYIFFCFLFLFL